MRLRHTAATAASALALALALPASPAGASTGPFTYVYNDEGGTPHVSLLSDPPGRACLNLPEVNEPTAQPAHSPKNYTSSVATVFTGPDCTGDYYTLRANGGRASELLKLRSVVFS
ncbi:hypothetical protein IPZ61_27945 [Streptomyces sioyaensis]|uniref:hypothetical protein n=1 Tax=Streptomyces sioyaensis TaxID=67364 RepID=UPI001F26637A|nr:hypothetical protein [Streptomyces sioyaensis]MCF3177135.1 hypothetical protein [Streptomyces sioyaensis]